MSTLPRPEVLESRFEGVEFEPIPVIGGELNLSGLNEGNTHAFYNFLDTQSSVEQHVRVTILPHNIHSPTIPGLLVNARCGRQYGRKPTDNYTEVGMSRYDLSFPPKGEQALDIVRLIGVCAQAAYNFSRQQLEKR